MGLRFAFVAGAATSVVAGLFFLACGIDEGGVVGGGTTDAFAPNDVVVVPDTSVPPSCGDAAACLKPGVPAGWQITALLGDPTAACPTSFAPVDLIKDISLTAGSCACSCSTVGTAACGDSVLTSGNSSGCTMDAGSVAGNGSCSETSGGGGQNVYLAASQPAVVGITCTPSRLGDAGAESVPVRLCDPTCQADFCGQLGGTATACIVSAGDVPCPGGYTQRTPLATGTDPSCAPCACGAPTSKCTGTVHVDTVGNLCLTHSWDLPATGTCTAGPITGSGTNSSFGAMWEDTTLPLPPYCAKQTDPGGDAGAVGVKTLCCP